MKKIFVIVGSSNAQGIEEGENRNKIFSSATIINLARPGANVFFNEKSSILHQVPAARKNFELIIFVGANTYKNDEYKPFTLQYRVIINRLIKLKWSKEQLNIVLPLVRGNDIFQNMKQHREIKKLKHWLDSKGILAVDVYDKLTPEQKLPEQLFGKKDQRSNKGVHYSSQTRAVIHSTIANIISFKLSRQELKK